MVDKDRVEGQSLHQETSRGLNVLSCLVISDKYIKTSKKCIIYLNLLRNMFIKAILVLQGY